MTDPQNPGTPAAGEPSTTPPAPPAYEQPAYSAPQPPAAPPYGSADAPAYGAPAAPAYSGGYAPAPEKPGRTMGIVALILAIVPVGLQLIGLILGIVALVQSKKAGQKNGMALAAIIVSAVLIVVGVIVTIALITWLTTASTSLYDQYLVNCAPGGAGYVEMFGERVPCEQIDTSDLD